jgi:hypothetical protein
MTRMQFLSQLATAKPGEYVVYHTGNLLYDRENGPEFQNVNAVAVAAYEAYDEARVTLVQKRIAPHVCAYIAIKLEYDIHLRADQKVGSHFVNKKLRNSHLSVK